MFEQFLSLFTRLVVAVEAIARTNVLNTGIADGTDDAEKPTPTPRKRKTAAKPAATDTEDDLLEEEEEDKPAPKKPATKKPATKKPATKKPAAASLFEEDEDEDESEEDDDKIPTLEQAREILTKYAQITSTANAKAALKKMGSSNLSKLTDDLRKKLCDNVNAAIAAAEAEADEAE